MASAFVRSLMNRDNNKTLLGVVCILLAAATIATFWPVLGNGFINYDDPDYVTANSMVQAGLTWAGVRWAFTTGYFGNWHPLTWLSHMLDCQLYGLAPAGHHATNLLLHAINAALLLLLIHKLSGCLWRSSVVAALFALHPLRVESVAWIAERKDVLSAFFALCALLAYVHYALARQNPARNHRVPYGGALACFTLGLMCKPMLVTLPGLFLLLDWWPLRRMTGQNPLGWRRLLVEKLPFGALALVSCVVTFKVQQHGGAMAGNYPIEDRVANTGIAYARYLAKTFWPADLAVFYPFPNEWPAELVLAAAGLIIGLSITAFAARRSAPHFLVGWLWFLGTLVPVIGLVQVGGASMADRYTYLPHIGLFVALVWTVAVPGVKTGPLRQGFGVASLAILIALATTTYRQTRVWHDSRSIWEHAVAVTTRNEVAHNNLGTVLQQEKDWPAAQAHYEAALAIKSRYPDAHYNLGNVLVHQGRVAEGREHLLRAIELRPAYAHAQLALASLELGRGDYAAAERWANEALRLRAEWFDGHFLLGCALAGQRQFTNAATEFSAALQLNDADTEAHYNLASALRELGRSSEAAAHFLVVINRRPSDVEARRLLAAELAASGDLPGALTNLQAALTLSPDSTNALQLAQMLVLAHRNAEAIPHYRAVLRSQPDWIIPYNDLAWILATHRDPTLRDGAEAVRLAEHACRATENKEPLLLGTLAAAWAEAGRFSDAVATAEKAIAVAQAAGQAEIVQRNQQLLELYRAGKAFHETP